ncbi:helix-turn-helix domain-containing protein [Salmonella enterica]|nr:helix-turn-helix domain-containing protein [Salmonella enterica]
MTAHTAEFFTLDEVNRLKIIQDVVDRRLTTLMAAQRLGISDRQCRRLLSRYREIRCRPSLLHLLIVFRKLTKVLSWTTSALGGHLSLLSWFRTNATITGPARDGTSRRRRKPTE